MRYTTDHIVEYIFYFIIRWILYSWVEKVIHSLLLFGLLLLFLLLFCNIFHLFLDTYSFFLISETLRACCVQRFWAVFSYFLFGLLRLEIGIICRHVCICILYKIYINGWMFLACMCICLRVVLNIWIHWMNNEPMSAIFLSLLLFLSSFVSLHMRCTWTIICRWSRYNDRDGYIHLINESLCINWVRCMVTSHHDNAQKLDYCLQFFLLFSFHFVKSKE